MKFIFQNNFQVGVDRIFQSKRISLDNETVLPCDINILFFSYFEKLQSGCSIKASHSSNYCKNTFLNHENRGPSMDAKDITDCLR